MSFFKKTGARKISLAASDEWDCGSDTRTVVHAAGRNRLAASGAQLRSTDGGVKEFIQN